MEWLIWVFHLLEPEWSYKMFDHIWIFQIIQVKTDNTTLESQSQCLSNHNCLTNWSRLSRYDVNCGEMCSVLYGLVCFASKNYQTKKPRITVDFSVFKMGNKSSKHQKSKVSSQNTNQTNANTQKMTVLCVQWNTLKLFFFCQCQWPCSGWWSLWQS